MSVDIAGSRLESPSRVRIGILALNDAEPSTRSQRSASIAAKAVLSGPSISLTSFGKTAGLSAFSKTAGLTSFGKTAGFTTLGKTAGLSAFSKSTGANSFLGTVKTAHLAMGLTRLADLMPPPLRFENYRAQATPAWLRHAVIRVAMRARTALMKGYEQWEAFVDDFTKLLGLGRPREWRESVSTALAGDWAALLWKGHLSPQEAEKILRLEAQKIHAQAQPLWERKTQHARVWLLDTPIGQDGSTLRDLQPDPGCPDPADAVLQGQFSDPHVQAVLEQLADLERKVALLWAHEPGTTWTEAAELAGAINPGDFGIRVRRKLLRLGKLRTARAASASATLRRKPGVPGPSTLNSG